MVKLGTFHTVYWPVSIVHVYAVRMKMLQLWHGVYDLSKFHMFESIALLQFGDCLAYVSLYMCVCVCATVAFVATIAIKMITVHELDELSACVHICT